MKRSRFSAFLKGVGFGLVTIAVAAGALFVLSFTSPNLQAVFSDLVGRWLNPYAQYEPDEFVYDYTLGADVPRVYYISIPKLELYAPVIAVYPQAKTIDGVAVNQLYVPNAFAVGWSAESAPVGEGGNTILVGHNNEYGEVFKNLWDLEVGDQIIIHTASRERTYIVKETAMFQEFGEGISTRQKNAAWINPTRDERITLITCWPYFSNTHRFVIVALPNS